MQLPPGKLNLELNGIDVRRMAILYKTSRMNQFNLGLRQMQKLATTYIRNTFNMVVGCTNAAHSSIVIIPALAEGSNLSNVMQIMMVN